MELKILGSSSAGNCYVFDNGQEALVVECGIAFNKVKEAVNFDISRIVGAIVSHEHGDHARHVKQFIDARINCFMSYGTADALNLDYKSVHPMVYTLSPYAVYHIGNFTVQPFDTKHDAAEPFGYLIYHHDCGTVLFATDTYYLLNTFSGLSNILIECNYSLDLLESNIASGRITKALRNRVIKSHMSIDTCRETLIANDLSRVNNIVLIHLSDGNSNATEFQRDVQEATGKTVHIANKGMTLKFNKTPF